MGLTLFQFGPLLPGDPLIIVFDAGIGEDETDVLRASPGIKVNQLVLRWHDFQDPGMIWSIKQFPSFWVSKKVQIYMSVDLAQYREIRGQEIKANCLINIIECNKW